MHSWLLHHFCFLRLPNIFFISSSFLLFCCSCTASAFSLWSERVVSLICQFCASALCRLCYDFSIFSTWTGLQNRINECLYKTMTKIWTWFLVAAHVFCGLCLLKWRGRTNIKTCKMECWLYIKKQAKRSLVLLLT